MYRHLGPGGWQRLWYYGCVAVIKGHIRGVVESVLSISSRSNLGVLDLALNCIDIC